MNRARRVPPSPPRPPASTLWRDGPSSVDRTPPSIRNPPPRCPRPRSRGFAPLPLSTGGGGLTPPSPAPCCGGCGWAPSPLPPPFSAPSGLSRGRASVRLPHASHAHRTLTQRRQRHPHPLMPLPHSANDRSPKVSPSPFPPPPYPLPLPSPSLRQGGRAEYSPGPPRPPGEGGGRNHGGARYQLASPRIAGEPLLTQGQRGGGCLADARTRSTAYGRGDSGRRAGHRSTDAHPACLVAARACAHAPRSRGRYRSGKAPPHPPHPAPCFPPLHGARAAQATPRLREYLRRSTALNSSTRPRHVP